MFRKPQTFGLAAAAAAVLTFNAGCAGTVAPSAASGPAMMSGGALVAPSGMTLYTFDRDIPGSGKSACNGPCATQWPPLTAGATDQPAGAYSVVTRDDGTKQWAYKGKPLYTYKNDQKAGDRTGDSFRDVWHVIKE